MGEERQAWLDGEPAGSAGQIGSTGHTDSAGQTDSAGSTDSAGQTASADRARELVAAARLVLVDFDGPLARLLPGDRWLEVAAEVRSRAGELGGAGLEETLSGEPDHVQCLRRAGELDPEVAPPLTELVTRLELEAAAQVRPGEHAVAFLEQCLDGGASVVVVTNNDPGVVTGVLDPARPGLAGRLPGILGRVPGRLDALKPSPAMLLQALELAGSAATDAVFLGDSVTDVEAGRAAGIDVVGVAEDAGRRADLLTAGALAAVPDVGHLLSGVISSEKQGLPHQYQRPIQFNSSAGKQPDGGV